MSDRDIFLAALPHTDPAARSAYLDRACAGDADLRRRVEELLHAHEAGDLRHTSTLEPSCEGSIDSTEESSGFLPAEHTQVVGFSPPGESSVEVDLLLNSIGGAWADPAQLFEKGEATPTSASRPAGPRMLDHYEVLRIVGRGGMGVVLEARDTVLQRMVAIKLLTPNLAASVAARKRFIREAQAAAAVCDNHVVSIYAVQELGPVPYMVMEFIHGVTLSERLRQTGALELAEVLHIGAQTAAGLAAAHRQGLVHRDIKPANLLLTSPMGPIGPIGPMGLPGAAEALCVKITDFGLARAGDDDSITHHGVISGTPSFMAPEQTLGSRIDHRTDLFSLGSVLYACCTGKLPFQASTTMAVLRRVCDEPPQPIREINPRVPEFLIDIISRLQAKNPDDRFQSAAEVAELFTTCLARLSQSTDPALDLPPAPRVAKKRRSFSLGLLACLAFPLVLALTGALFLMPSARQPGPPARVAHPLDGRKRQDIPLDRLALAGGGDPERAPAELVAVLGEGRFLHRHGLQGLACSRDGKLLAVCASTPDPQQRRHTGWEVKVWHAHSGRLFRSLATTCAVHAVAFSPNGKRLATVNAPPQNTVTVWDLASGEELFTLKGHAGEVRSTDFSSDGKFIATAGQDGKVVLWNAADGERRFTLDKHTQGVAHVTFSPNGKRLASSADDGSVFVWPVAAGKAPVQHVCPTGNVRGAAFSPDGGRIVSVSSHASPQVWEAATGQTLFELKVQAHEALCVAWSGDGKHIATGGADRTVKIWDARTGKRLHSCIGHQEPVSCVAFTPDGSQLISGSLDGTLRLWNPASGQGVSAINAVAFSPDGRLLASGGSARVVQLWDLATGQIVHTLTGHTEAVFSLAFRPDGKQVASGSFDGTIALWDVASGAEVRTFKAHSHSFSHICFSPDGQTLAAGGDGFVKLWDAASGKEEIFLPEHPGRVRCAAFSPDGRWLASGGEDRTVRLHDLHRGRSQTFKAVNIVNKVAFSPTGRTLAAVCDAPEAALLLWNVDTGKETILQGHAAHVHALAFSPAGGFLATGSQDGGLRLWDWAGLAPRSLTFGAGAFRGWVRSVAFAPDGRYLASGNGNDTVTILRVPLLPPPHAPDTSRKLPDPVELAGRASPADALDRRAIPQDLLKRAGGDRAPAELVAVLAAKDQVGDVFAVAVSPDGRTLASIGADRAVRLWDLADGRLRRTLTGHKRAGSAIAFSPNGKVLASASEDATIRLWDVATGKDLAVLTGHDRRINHVAFTPDGVVLASAADDGTVKLWNLPTATARKTFRGNLGSVWTVAFSPDGKTLASGEYTGRIPLRETATGWDLGVLHGHRARARCVAFDPTGRYLASAFHGSSPSLRIWDVFTRQEEHQLEGHASGALACVWRPDGRLLASCGGLDGAVHLYDMSGKLPRCKVLTVLPSGKRMVHGIAFTPEGRHLAAANPDGTIYLLRLAARGEVFQVPPRPQ